MGKTVRSYLWWTHERGSFHYDVMVTLILLFVFVGPMFIDFKDKPAERKPHPMGVMVQPDGANGFVYRIDARAVNGTSDEELRTAFRSVIEPIAGEARILRYEPVQDTNGKTVAWRVWVRRGMGS
ncbi:MAG TPA: hypothetical protein VMT82_07135 [candidate division Zixibacteria bacterium]|nr:hypothetical protein [candidate division Zixibacteria bacterium]